jgi:hypothetical protein
VTEADPNIKPQATLFAERISAYAKSIIHITTVMSEANRQPAQANASHPTTQPAPTPNDSTPIADLVIDDLLERKRIGIERYSVPLQAHNGRDALIDAYEEILDLTIYLRQVIEERPWQR